jgi:hypothetical protein
MIFVVIFSVVIAVFCYAYLWKRKLRTRIGQFDFPAYSFLFREGGQHEPSRRQPVFGDPDFIDIHPLYKVVEYSDRSVEDGEA